jgi:hypothetical protein
MVQAWLTWGFVLLSELSQGQIWEPQAKVLVILAIVATWGMALRTIRARLVELIRFLRVVLGQRGHGEAAQPEAADQARRVLTIHYVAKSMLWLRIIAAGITLPFFVLPLFVSGACLFICWRQPVPDSQMAGLALLLSVLAAIVGAYFHWSIVPPPRPAPQPTLEQKPQGKANEG